MKRASLRYPAETAICVVAGFVTPLPLEQAREQNFEVLQVIKWRTGIPFLTHNENVDVAIQIHREELAEAWAKDQEAICEQVRESLLRDAGYPE